MRPRRLPPRSVRDRIFQKLATRDITNEESEYKTDSRERKAIQIIDKVEKFSADSKLKAQTAIHTKLYGKGKKKKTSLRKSFLGV
jgi:hypothetical protein